MAQRVRSLAADPGQDVEGDARAAARVSGEVGAQCVGVEPVRDGEAAQVGVEGLSRDRGHWPG
jgi:hypothetical protein